MFVLAGSAVWVAAIDADAGLVRVRELAAADLSDRADVFVPIGPDAEKVAIAVAPSNRDVFVGAGHVVATVSTASATVADTFTASPGSVGAIAATTGGDLYLAMNSQVGTIALQLRDAETGTVTSTVPFGNWIDHIVPTSGGIWLSSHAGMQATTRFYPGGDLHDTSRQVFTGASSPSPTVTVVHGIAWIGTSNGLACADGATGALIDKVATTDVASYSDISVGHRRWMADFLGNAGQGVATFTPPARCTS